MGNRLSKIITRTGDEGTTGLGDGSRVEKDSPRIEAVGCVDELNSFIGVILATPALAADISHCLSRVQHDLFDLGGELAVPGYAMVTDAHIAQLEADVEHFNETLPPLKEFILPGGGQAAAHCHVARTVARRTERRCWTLAKTEGEVVSQSLVIYLNRLSDLLFVLSRVLNRSAGQAETLWQPASTK